MSTSGSTDLSLTASQVVDQAFGIMGLMAAGESLSAEDAAAGSTALDLMLKTWGAEAGGHLWLNAETTLTLTESQATYSLPTDIRSVEGVWRHTSGIDTPLTPVSREEYYNLPNKSGTGTPVNFYVDRQRSRATLYVWPTASAAVAASTTLVCTARRVIEDVDALTNDPDVPSEWLETLAYGLAARLCARYGVPADRRAEIKADAAALKGALASQDDETTSVFLGIGR